MANTLVYDEGVNGWPSFYSYDPDYMIGMNNYFYSFNGGNLYRHNTNETRNNFYGVQYNSTVTSVFNDNPLENKIFKTINLEGDSRWSITLASDIQVGGFVEASYYEEKEGSFYAFVRNAGTIPAQASEYVLRSLNGIGRSESVTGGTIVSFDLSTDLSTIMSVGDALYFALPPYTAPQLAGTITSINIDLPNGVNNIVINIAAPAVAIPIQDAFFLYIKNAVAESHGILGHYGVFTITNVDTIPINLFTVESEVMKSYP
tara:strand:+ start:2514 stop:3293 length:780 start_codon:yes stop_codon:yes gene_type:complete